MRWVGHVASMGKRKCSYSVLVGNPDGKCRLWRPRLKTEDNIRMDLQGV